jgi:hypothetical protein
MTGKCLYCGADNRPLTREHVWPEWLGKYLPDFDRGRSDRWSSNRGREWFEVPFLTATVKDFCAECNNGPMAVIEATAASLVRDERQDVRWKRHCAIAGVRLRWTVEALFPRQEFGPCTAHRHRSRSRSRSECGCAPASGTWWAPTTSTASWSPRWPASSPGSCGPR